MPPTSGDAERRRLCRACAIIPIGWGARCAASASRTRPDAGGCADPTGASCAPGTAASPPFDVADYVCAHEAAHLVAMDNSPRFWRKLDSIFPRRAAAEAWLRRYGDRFHRISLGQRPLSGPSRPPR
jgi:hypothetical protein